MLNTLKDRVVSSTTALFSHGPQPLEHTLDHIGDPGLLGPDSVSWAVIGDASAFVGGIRALLVQTAHPEVMAGVDQHSAYRVDPLGRLSRTSVYVTETTYGAIPEVEAAVGMVRRAHRRVRGTSDRNIAYSARHPEMAAWVHNVLTESFLAAYQAYGPRRLSRAEADSFVEEQTRIGSLLTTADLPTTASDLSEWISSNPSLGPSAAQRRAIDFLRRPPLPIGVGAGYRVLADAAVSTIPARLRGMIGLSEAPAAEVIGRSAVGSLRWALGSSPSWHLALVRCGAEVPDGLFRQPLPAAAELVTAQP